MKIEQGFLVQADIMERLENFELFEIYTDGGKKEDAYRAFQKSITGLNANPTYLVLDSRSQLEVARSAYTNSKEEYVQFIERGQTDRPVFRSTVVYSGLERVLEDGRSTREAFITEGAIEADAGEVIGKQSGLSPEGVVIEVDKRAYSGEFWAKQQFRVADDVPPGRYTLRAKLIGQVWGGEEFITVEGVTAKFQIQVGEPATAKR
ncbi:MAG: hypothetical protein AAF488_09185 [Planctomycetota bacterium]